MSDSYPIKIWSGLLSDGHTQKIENALWEFIWLVNKVTKEENGIGYVLGGKPIKVEDIKNDLGRSYQTVYRHLQQLKKNGYINIKKAPYGLIITVNNSKKFSNKSLIKNDKAGLDKNDKTDERLIKNDKARLIKNEKRLIKNDKANKILNDIKYNNIYIDVIDYLNKKTNSNYKYTTRRTRDLIKARVNEGFTLDDFKIVIDKKVKSWAGTEWERYLRPETLFGTKFESYLNEKIISNKKQGEEYVKSYRRA